ncbi:SGNH hydrolase-type esterase domain-containing protein [Aspergillus pseudotamarii]|uniref:SGNH hydrolase-type esterase domain-containing protein n=1 Tax=Aspergillus pseudotamarii TaxID=132259 RepID=A0A5N6SMH7_ASPPS|nr:SGNH hydrolase-type esterase domain-containing protein [Aspergillus pseudotamarii]KAE8135882.1 SGNH hydrolase-type esterase domain-containing protein [Aspergillus pseudotamarii]
MHLKYLYLWGFFAVSGLADDINFSAAAQSISAVLADPTFVPYTKPNQKIEEFIALGDSYTAGTGCNGNDEIMGGDALRGKRAYPMQMSQDKDNWAFVNNGDETLPRFSFHAYTGDTSQELVVEQLQQGAYEDKPDRPRGQPFGKPQVAVLTIGGNDAGLSSILNDCIYRAWLPGDCQTTLNALQQEIDNGNLRDKVNYAMYQVARAGREAGGANPRESFQVYVLEYLTFFDDALDPVCNDYTWAYFPSWMTDQPPLTQELRKQLNDMTRKVNAVIKAAAQDLQRMGIIYVEGLQDAYNGHRFCEPGATKEQTESKVWFWSQYSKINTPSEGPGDPNAAAVTGYVDPAQELLDFVFPGQNKVIPTTQTADTSPPWEWDGAEKYADFDSLLRAISAAAGDDVEATVRPPFPVLRSFHPKGTPYTEHATALFAAMADNRAAVATGGEGQQIAIASYINPLGDPASWERLLAYDSKKISVLVANILNSPDYVVNNSWKSVIEQAANQDKKILGYIRTGYLSVNQQQFTTRLDSKDLTDWASQIEQDIDKWFELYSTSLGGIFFDEG